MSETFKLAINGQPVYRYKDTIFVSLPIEVWQIAMGDGHCICDVCKADGGDTLCFWDTAVIGAKPPKGHQTDYASCCHFPEHYSKDTRVAATRLYWVKARQSARETLQHAIAYLGTQECTQGGVTAIELMERLDGEVNQDIWLAK